MWNDAVFRRDVEPTKPNPRLTGFIDKKGVEWSVMLRELPERRGRIALDFASATGKRRSAEIQALQLEELRNLSEQAWQTLLANAAVIEME
jgi:hypothetical protein